MSTTTSPPHLNSSSLSASSQPANHGSRTVTITTNDEEVNGDQPQAPATLRLRARPLQSTRQSHPRVQWEDNVVDNEGLGRKKSKVCCIYKKPRAFDESSDESGDSDSDCCHHSPPSSNPALGSSSSKSPSKPSDELEVNSSVSASLTCPSRSNQPNAYEVESIKLKVNFSSNCHYFIF
ncbi:phosphatase inhibitor-domain-containing protein [Phakopsora pachyrhizi]|nr:phosphatase inhibitor-domain-containing protein [Phakopsora pachyrhizi]